MQKTNTRIEESQMEVKKEKMIGQGNTAEIYRVDDNKILKLFRSGLYK